MNYLPSVHVVSAQNIVPSEQPLQLESALVHVLQAKRLEQQELMGSPLGIEELVVTLAVQALHPATGR